MRIAPFRISQPIRLLVPAVCALLLGGCGDERGLEDLEKFINKARMERGRVEPLPRFKLRETFRYAAAGERDPFRNWQVDSLAALADNRDKTGLRPDIDRPRETLESFPLDALRLRGTLRLADTPWALVEAPDGIVYKVRPGNHMGKNFGEIRRIEENSVVLAEIVSDGLGGWRKRETTLSIADER